MSETPGPTAPGRLRVRCGHGPHTCPPPTAVAQADALAALVRATLTPIVGPLVAELAAGRQTVERRADQLVTQAETIGRLEAENDALRDARASTEAPALVGPLWVRPWPVVAVLAVLVVTGAV